MGRGVTIDYVEAVHWFERAVEQFECPAIFNLACSYQDGTGKDFTLENFLLLLISAAKRGPSWQRKGSGSLDVGSGKKGPKFTEGNGWLNSPELCITRGVERCREIPILVWREVHFFHFLANTFIHLSFEKKVNQFASRTLQSTFGMENSLKKTWILQCITIIKLQNSNVSFLLFHWDTKPAWTQKATAKNLFLNYQGSTLIGIQSSSILKKLFSPFLGHLNSVIKRQVHWFTLSSVEPTSSLGVRSCTPTTLEINLRPSQWSTRLYLCCVWASTGRDPPTQQNKFSFMALQWLS